MKINLATSDFFKLSPFPSWIYSENSKSILSFNSLGLKVWGNTQKHVQVLCLEDLMPSNEVDRFLNAIKPLEFGEESVFLGNFLLNDKNGNSLYFEIHAAKVEVEGNPCVLAICRDITKEKSDQNQLQLLYKIASNTNDSVLITDADPFHKEGLKIVYVNDSFSRMTGYSASEVLGKSPKFLQGPNSNYQELAKLKQAVINGNESTITTVNYKKSGEEFLIHFKLFPVKNEEQIITNWIAIQKDITELKGVEENLIKAKEIAEENERKMKEAQKLAHLGSWYYDVINQVSEWSEETYNIWGLDPSIASVNLKDHEKLVHPKDWNRFNEVINHAIENGISYKMELDLLRPDGTYKTVNTIGAPIFDNNKKVIAFKGTTQDISERIIIENELKKAKEKAEKSQLTMAQASKLAKIGYWDYNFKTDRLNWSDFVFSIYGLDPNDPVLTYNEAISFFDKPSQEKILQATQELLLNGEAYDLELKLINSKNEDIHIRMLMQPVYDSNQQVIGESGVLQNVTAEKYLQDLNREVARMVKIGSWSIDLTENKVFWSEQIHQLHETDPKTYVPNLEDGINFFRNDFREMVRLAVVNTIETGEGWDFEAVIVTAKKNELWIRSIGNAEIVNGKCIRLYGGFQDIDHRKQAELAKNRFQETLENSLNEIYMFDAETLLFTYVNKGAILNLGYTLDELLKLTPLDLKPEFTEQTFGQLVSPLKRNEKDKVIFFTHHKRKDGSLYPVEVHLKLVTYSKTKSFVAIILDITERKKAEQDLISTSERLRLATSSAKMGIWDWDIPKNQLIWDDRMYEMYRIQKEDFEGAVSAWQKVLHPDDFEQANKDLNDALEGKREFNSIFRVVWPDKSIRYIEGNAIVSRDINGKPVRMIGGNIDITDRKNTEFEILRANERFEKVTEATDDAIWDWDIQNDKFYRSNMIERFFGKNALKYFSSSNFWKDPFHPDDVVRIKESVLNALSDPAIKKWKTEYRIINPEGEIRFVVDQGVIVRDQYGKALRMVGAMTDITEQKISEKENRFKASLLKTVGQAAIATDLNGVISFWNKAAESIFGWSEDETIGQEIDRICPNDLNEEQKDEIMDLLKSGKTWSGEFQIQNKAKKWIPVRGSRAPIYDENDLLSGIISISSDISSERENQYLLKRYTQDLERSNEELEQFAYVASHDLQEPLRMISSFMQLLERKYGSKLDERAHQYIHFATDGAKRMKNIVLDLLEYSRASKPTVSKENIQLDKVIQEYLLLRKKIISEKSATIHSQELPTVYTYKAGIVQVFHSLLDNAIKYSKPGVSPSIEVGFETIENEWKFSIKDNGIGIAPQFHEKIFVIFQRLHNQDEFEGTGIGLSIAKKNVEFLGGRIWLESTPGEGSIFHFTLPKG
ncbi:PAS domain S-box protein [Algoriphagus sp. AK58]|uniref:PAS domain S-box protein n=1 Tax=Algoriphagus sp. AK58 TaxID=1406877 RepID=UPI00164FBD60|nr:PAS domain S-box protein [Algoriphagus sp. AK58]MBC6365811.1 hypothetical protein [Algoriphagus sp. AK58]